MKRELFKQVIADQLEYDPPTFFFKRTQMNTIQQLIHDPCIILLSGLRRSGKSTLQRLFQKKLLPSNYLFNFDDERLVQFEGDDFQALLETFIELFGKQSIFYFDEIQTIRGWEQWIRRLHEGGNKIFISGSNASLLSKELETHLMGHYVFLEIYPLSFREILQHEHPSLLTQQALSTEDIGTILHQFSIYLKHGGIPEYFTCKKPEYLKNLYEGILYRDIVSRNSISDAKALRKLVYYFASNVGKEFSYTKLSAVIGVSSPHTVSNYCLYLEQSYLCLFLGRYSHSLTKQIQYNKKCYLIDPAFIHILGLQASSDKSKLLENIVFIHLKAKAQELYFHKEQKECDFIIKQNNQIVQAIQVTTTLSDKQIKEREISGLIEAMSKVVGGLRTKNR